MRAQQLRAARGDLWRRRPSSFGRSSPRPITSRRTRWRPCFDAPPARRPNAGRRARSADGQLRPHDPAPGLQGRRPLGTPGAQPRRRRRPAARRVRSPTASTRGTRHASRRSSTASRAAGDRTARAVGPAGHDRDASRRGARPAVVRRRPRRRPAAGRADDHADSRQGRRSASRRRREAAARSRSTRATIAVLREHRRRMLEERLARRLRLRRPRPRLPPARRSVPSPGRRQRSASCAVSPSYGLPRLTLKGLRHTWATLALERGIHPRVVQERLGHSTIAITLGIYSHVAPTLHDEAAQLVADLVLDR